MDRAKMRDLDIPDLFSQLQPGSAVALTRIYMDQVKHQINTYGYDYDLIRGSLKSMREYADWNYHAIQDELREFFEALGGVDSGGNAIWKPWKAKHREYEDRGYDSLSEAEKIELKMELIDLFKFFLNLCILVELKPEDMYNYFMAKGDENVRRQQTGY